MLDWFEMKEIKIMMCNQGGVLHDLSTLLHDVIDFHGVSGGVRTPPRRRMPEITPAGVASLLLGVSMALMLCGSLTFVIGFILMPWVLGLFAVFHLLGLFFHLSLLGKSLFAVASIPISPRPSPISEKLSKQPIL